MVRRAVMALALIGVLNAPLEVKAQTSLGVDFTSVSTTMSTGSWTLGWSFNVLNDITVNSLGFFDAALDGLLGSHDVGLWDPFGTLIASATVPSGTGSTLMGFFRMVSIAPVSLLAGNDYRIAAVTGADMYGWGPNGFTTDSSIQFVSGAYWPYMNAGLKRPTQFDSNGGYFGPNFGIEEAQAQLEQELLTLDPQDVGASTAPEPMSLLLVGTGLAGIAGARRRKQEGEMESEAATA